MRRSRFDVFVKFNGHTLEVSGYMTPYLPATRWDPAEGADIENQTITLMKRRRDGRWAYRRLVDEDGKLFDKIQEAVHDAYNNKEDVRP